MSAQPAALTDDDVCAFLCLSKRALRRCLREPVDPPAVAEVTP